ncbi:hypothetical protein L2E82_39792 [Cichorium intybus]|uniref:Uncharacterized protein n=1 Tax=Cichorium intybus TaxID=13427 RepID=A0ACB9AK72_CICIN|nr:hypothetical protein L2E82_39792 [Cichorium intybus]
MPAVDGGSFWPVQSPPVVSQFHSIEQLCAQASRHLCLPGSRFLLSKSNREIKSLKMEVERLLMEIIQSRRDCVEIGRSSSYGNDLLGMLLNEMQKKRAENGFSLNLQVCNGGSPSVEHLSKLNLEMRWGLERHYKPSHS